MAKSYRIVKMVSEEDTGYYYTTTRSTKGPKTADKLRLKKYDPVIRNHWCFNESKKLK